MISHSTLSDHMFVPCTSNPGDIVLNMQKLESYVTARNPFLIDNNRSLKYLLRRTMDPVSTRMQLSKLWEFYEESPLVPSYNLCL